MNRVLLSAALLLSGSALAQSIPFVSDALNYARTGTVAKDTRAVVYATVTLVSALPAQTADRTVVAYGSGPLDLGGAAGAPQLTGEFPVLWNTGKPFLNTGATVSLTLNPDGSALVGLKLDGKNFLGRPPAPVKFTPAGEVLVATGTNLGSFRTMTLTLNKGIWPPPAAQTAKPVQPAQPPKPTGVRVRVSSRLVVTNADDGFADNTVELYGPIRYNTGELNLYNNSAGKGTQFAGETIIVDIPFANADARFLSVAGRIVDRDSLSKTDLLWQHPGAKFDLLKAVQDKPQGPTSWTLPGDRNDESADVQITVEKVEDLY
ncbi:hypothetical protein [Deinococcus aquaedulcis]|uniref:hypothetical protein n=1 Tax=Deinococcus aquaedulcis TaxID=2840455 RepID=UPI001C83170D|nr:hypothetical protein [Deinococcus aquaedulcis]